MNINNITVRKNRKKKSNSIKAIDLLMTKENFVLISQVLAGSDMGGTSLAGTLWPEAASAARRALLHKPWLPRNCTPAGLLITQARVCHQLCCH